ncbi:toxin Cry1Ac domain D-VI-related protein [Enterococcus raffinosus]|uniref:toxin Cry1Ac domain D-VI-related protein n=1 Tax=Enterococcus raffinosus TaxID=71452 RepID=UPI003ACFA785
MYKKKRYLCTIFISLIVINISTDSMYATTSKAALPKQSVVISDKNLKKSLNEKLGQNQEEGITVSQLKTISELDINNKNITSIDGLQYCTNLKKLVIGNFINQTKENNSISDLSPLKNLSKLNILIAGGLNITDFSPIRSLHLNYCTDADLTGSYLGNQTAELVLYTDNFSDLSIKNIAISYNGTPLIPNISPTNSSFSYQYETQTNTIKINYQPVYKDDNEKEEKLAFAGNDFKNEIAYTEKSDLVHGRITIKLHSHVNSLFQQATNLLNQLFINENHTELSENVTQFNFLKIFDILQKLSVNYPTSGFQHKNEILSFTNELDAAVILFTTQEINSLFTDTSDTILSKNATQQKIDVIKSDINKLVIQDKNAKEKLLARIEKAQLLLLNGNVSEEQDTVITYNGEADIPDPDHPFDPYYVVSTPGNVTFTDDNKTFNGSLDMLKVDENGNTSAYDGDGVADVSVKSANKLQLNTAAKDDAVDYSFQYATTAGAAARLDKQLDVATSDQYQKLFSIDKTNATHNVRYKMTGKAAKKGAHTDTLTYKIISTTPATK